MREKKLLALEKKAIKLARDLQKVIDTIYEADEIFGEKVLEAVNDEGFLRERLY
jgi:hypothetical protein